MITRREFIVSNTTVEELSGEVREIRRNMIRMANVILFMQRERFDTVGDDFKLLCDYLGVEITTTPEKRAVKKKEI